MNTTQIQRPWRHPSATPRIRGSATAVLVFVLVAACSSPHSFEGPAGSKDSNRAARQPRSSSPAREVLELSPGEIGQVVSVNREGQFAVILFPLGRLPEPGSRLQVFRDAVGVGEVLITGPAREHMTVGDITSGECRAGDRVAEKVPVPVAVSPP